jgi:hypothetical protein
VVVEELLLDDEELPFDEELDSDDDLPFEDEDEPLVVLEDEFDERLSVR